MVETRRPRTRVAPDDAFAALYQRHHDAVWLYCRRRVGADGVDDAVADVFLAVWRRVADAPPAPEALPWLYRIAYLTISNHWRGFARQRRLQRKVSSLSETRAADVDDQVVHRSEVRAVVSLLDRLKEADAEILRLSAWEGLEIAEISAVLDISTDATKQRLSRARRRLADLYERKLGGGS